MHRVWIGLFLGSMCLFGCDDDEDGRDGGVVDSGVPDGGGTDAGGRDAGAPDAGGRLDPSSLTPFVDPLPRPGTVLGASEDGTPRRVTIGMWAIAQQLHAELPPTPVWAYGESEATASYPGPTIEARTGAPLEVEWQNHLPSEHFLPVDETIHWAAPNEWPGQGVPTVVHVHGGLQAGASDGHPDAWFTPDFAQTGPAFVDRVYRYPNVNAPETLWYHDHALGITRLNVYAGLAGFYILRDPAVEDALNLPSGDFEHLMLLQDRAFTSDGALFYPREGVNPDVHPEWVPEFFGDVNLVNGVVWPHLEVEARRYRFRILNGANARFYELRMSNGLPFVVIGTDGGYVGAPVTVERILLGPAERVDVVVDFSGAAPGERIQLTNSANAPYPGGDPVTEGTARVMQFRVVEASGVDESVVPETIDTLPDLLPAADTTRTLTLIEQEDANTGDPLGVFLNGQRWGPPGSVTELPRVGSTEIWELVNLTDDAHPIHLHLIDFLVVERRDFDVPGYRGVYDELNPEIPAEAVTNPDVNPFLRGEASPPEDYERGWKDTVIAFPGQVTRIVVRWAPETGGAFPFDSTAAPGYVWHCHILEHEDNEMMRRLQLVAE